MGLINMKKIFIGVIVVLVGLIIVALSTFVLDKNTNISQMIGISSCDEPLNQDGYLEAVDKWTYNPNFTQSKCLDDGRCLFLFGERCVNGACLDILVESDNCEDEILSYGAKLSFNLNKRNVYHNVVEPNEFYLWCGGSDKNLVFQANQKSLVEKYFDEFC